MFNSGNVMCVCGFHNNDTVMVSSQLFLRFTYGHSMIKFLHISEKMQAGRVSIIIGKCSA